MPGRHPDLRYVRPARAMPITAWPLPHHTPFWCGEEREPPLDASSIKDSTMKKIRSHLASLRPMRQSQGCAPG